MAARRSTSGERRGLVQWRRAVEGSGKPDDWTAHAPLALEEVFEGSPVRFDVQPSLNLDTELRFHLAKDLHRFVAGLLGGESSSSLKPIAEHLDAKGYHLRITRDLDMAKNYLRERYAEDRDARFGLVASSKDKDLGRFGVPNGFQYTDVSALGPCTGTRKAPTAVEAVGRSSASATEFGAQGLELDATLLAWGTDFVLKSGKWSNDNARGYRLKRMVKDPFQLRMNAYRVLLTRGRDGCVVFMPALPELDETFSYLRDAGFRGAGLQP